jgi:hypothetical protein
MSAWQTSNEWPSLTESWSERVAITRTDCVTLTLMSRVDGAHRTVVGAFNAVITRHVQSWFKTVHESNSTLECSSQLSTTNKNLNNEQTEKLTDYSR